MAKLKFIKRPFDIITDYLSSNQQRATPKITQIMHKNYLKTLVRLISSFCENN